MKRPIFALTVVLIASLVVASAVFALATATSVDLSGFSDCTHAGLDIGLESSGADYEAGMAVDANGTVLIQFGHGTALGNFSGIYYGYNYPFYDAPSSPIIGLYASVGNVPATPANTAEWFLIYNCDTQEILHTCFGPFGTCAQTPAEYYAPADSSCPNPLPSGFSVRNIPAGALAYYQPDANTYAGFNLPPGTWYAGAAEDGFVEVWIACQATNVFVPAENVN
ncbi:MAG: hypothetical protein L6Q98_15845 [Anaerolineae bacterium]|nr:hypothetical protein [Anaerolineae bacterium]NUQ06433.1 hypothetical protein [Anaerolineae bacterium]